MLLHQLSSIDVFHPKEFELVGKPSRSNSQVERALTHPTEAPHGSGEVERVAKWDERGRAKPYAIRHTGKVGEGDKGIHECCVRALHPMGLKDDMIPHPQA
jgi:hypothetical protein